MQILGQETDGLPCDRQHVLVGQRPQRLVKQLLGDCLKIEPAGRHESTTWRDSHLVTHKADFQFQFLSLFFCILIYCILQSHLLLFDCAVVFQSN